MSRGAVLVSLGLITGAAAIAAVIAVALSRKDEAKPGSAPPPPSWKVALADDFTRGVDTSVWAATSESDFEEKAITPEGDRLKFRCATRGTHDKTVKFFGLRTTESFSFGKELQVSADIDWNQQSNGSYLSAGLVLCPAMVDGNPLAEGDFLRVEYIGVPPGENGRLVVVVRNGGVERYLHTEGWPDQQREGRPLGVQKVDIFIKDRSFRIVENGRPIFQSEEKALGFNTAHLYLQMSSHSNYPPREIYFDNVSVKSLN